MPTRPLKNNEKQISETHNQTYSLEKLRKFPPKTEQNLRKNAQKPPKITEGNLHFDP